MNWLTKNMKEEKDRFNDNIIKLSEMVDDGKLSSTAAKTVFSEMYDAHKKNLYYIKQIDQIF